MRMNNKGEITIIELIVIFTVVATLFSIIGGSIFKASTEALLYNEKYGKHYTTWQFVTAGDTIKSFLEGGQQSTQNININGAIPVKIAN